MRIDEYYRVARSTAVYDAPFVYPAMGLAGEAGETLDKLFPIQDENGPATVTGDVVKELGDILWYIVNTAHDAGFHILEVVDRATGGLKCNTFDELQFERVRADDRRSPYLLLAVHTCAFAELTKKILRDGKKIEPGKVREMLVLVLLDLCSICDRSGLKLGDVAAENAAKLLSRQARGKIQGDGDNR